MGGVASLLAVADHHIKKYKQPSIKAGQQSSMGSNSSTELLCNHMPQKLTTKAGPKTLAGSTVTE
jgi:hypothetical protein